MTFGLRYKAFSFLIAEQTRRLRPLRVFTVQYFTATIAIHLSRRFAGERLTRWSAGKIKAASHGRFHILRRRARAVEGILLRLRNAFRATGVNRWISGMALGGRTRRSEGYFDRNEWLCIQPTAIEFRVALLPTSSALSDDRTIPIFPVDFLL